jgi:hypothetical protein
LPPPGQTARCPQRSILKVTIPRHEPRGSRPRRGWARGGTEILHSLLVPPGCVPEPGRRKGDARGDGGGGALALPPPPLPPGARGRR